MTESSAVTAQVAVPRKSNLRVISSILLVMGAVIIVASMAVGWYVVQLESPSGCTKVSETLFPFWVTVSATGSYCPASETGSFVAAGLAATGVLYIAAGVLTAVAAVLALLAGGFLYRGKWSPRSRTFVAFAVVAIVAGGLAPTLVALGQPSAVCFDQGYRSTPLGASGAGAAVAPANTSSGSGSSCNWWSFSPGSGTSSAWSGSSGPWNSFFGKTSSYGSTFSWGPATGWFIDLWGVALIAVGALTSRRTANDESN